MNQTDKSKLAERHVSIARPSRRSLILSRHGLRSRERAVIRSRGHHWNEAAPCNISLSRQAQVVKLCVRVPAGCTPREVHPTITVTDGSPWVCRQ